MGLLSEMQRFFKDEYEFGGRYVQKIIMEWEKNDSINFKKFINGEFHDSSKNGLKIPSSYRLQEEYPYKSGRFADLAVMDGDLPLLLIEIKWNDLLGKEKKDKDSQLNDYINYCLEQKCSLLILTKNPLSELEINNLKKLKGQGRHCYFGKLATYLEPSTSPVSRLFYEYLSDKGIIMNDINLNELYLFFNRLVNPRSGSGRALGATDQFFNTPTQFSNLMNNMRLISQEISPKINGLVNKNSSNIDFSISQNYSKNKITKSLKADGETEDEITFNEDSREGGSISVFARNRIFSAPMLSIEYGFIFKIKPNKEHNFEIGMKSWIYDRNINQYTEENYSKEYIKMLGNGSNKPKIVSELKNLMAKTLQKCINEGVLDPEREKTLNALVRELS